MELFNVIAVEEVKPLLNKHFSTYNLGSERVPVEEAVDRVLAVDVVSDLKVPAFRRSTKDGYAVISTDVAGASESETVKLKLNGEILMGAAASAGLKHGETVYVPTGGMIPDGADALVMIEYTRLLGDDAIVVNRPVAVKENVINIGEDIDEGSVVLRTGRRMTPADLGVLTSVGISSVDVFEKPKVSIISTGDEIAAPGEELTLGMVRDINTYTVSAAAEKAGCEVVIRRVVRDDEELLKKVLAECHKASDIVFISGGSSVGVRDYSLPAISSLGSPGILCHGIAFKPGKPTIIARAGEKPVIGLPGHPVSALVVFSIVGEYLISLMNRTPERIESWVEAVLVENISGAPGRETWQMVELRVSENGYEAVPVHGESGLITMLATAHGTVRIPRYTDGMDAGAVVKVFPV